MVFILFLFIGMGYSLLSCAWLDARDARRWRMAVLIDMAMDTMSWLPVGAFVVTTDWRVAAASIIGSGIGTGISLRHEKAPPGRGDEH